MSNRNRKQYLTATTLDQFTLDQMHDNLVGKFGLVVEIEAPPFDQIGLAYTIISPGVVEFTKVDHGLVRGNIVTLSNSFPSSIDGNYPIENFSKDTFQLDVGGVPLAGNSDCFSPKTIYASDENMYVGDTFYHALLVFPTVKRTVGEWLSPNLEFSTISLNLSNVDGRFNEFLPGGTNYGGWVQKNVVIKMGLRDVASTYTTIFSGRVTEVGGVGRTLKTITVVARDNFEKINIEFPIDSLNRSEFPDIEESIEGQLKPIIYGDWTVRVNEETGASIPCIPVNGESAIVLDGTNNVAMYISDNDNISFDTSSVVLVRSSKFFPFSAADVVGVPAGNNNFTLRQEFTGGVTLVEGALYIYKKGDKFFCKLKGKDVGGGALDDNIISQAEDILFTYSGIVPGDLDSSWGTFKAKAAPAQSAIANIKSRVYRNEGEKVITYVLSMFEQVRLEAFLDRNLKLKISSLHFEDFPAVPTHTVREWDTENHSLKPKIDTRNNFNRGQGFYNLLPDVDDNYHKTSTYRNQASIDQASGKLISKGIVFPNLYIATDVENQLIEILRLASSYFEIIEVTNTWRSILLDIGDFVKLDINIGAIVFEGTPAMIRDIGYASKGRKLNFKLWSFQMLPYPGYNPGFDGIIGGYNAVIDVET